MATVKGSGASVTVYTFHTDHLTGSNACTSAGAQAELMDYYSA